MNHCLTKTIIMKTFSNLLTTIIIILSVIFLTVSLFKYGNLKDTRIDYHIILHENGEVDVIDKHGNKTTIDFENLEEYIEQDNI